MDHDFGFKYFEFDVEICGDLSNLIMLWLWCSGKRERFKNLQYTIGRQKEGKGRTLGKADS